MATDVQSASYVVYLDSSGNTNARNGTTGTVDYSGTNSLTVIQDAISALTSGGRIFIRNGTYSLTGTNPLTISNANISLEGESYGAVITQANATNLTHLIRVTAGFCTIRCLRVDGNAQSQTGGSSLVLLDVGGSDAKLNEVWLLNAYGHALYINAGVQRVQVLDCYFKDVGNRGIHVPNLTPIFNVDSSIVGCYFEAVKDFGIGAVFCQNLAIDGNVFVGGLSKREPINLDSCQQCAITGNTVRDSGDSGIVVDNDLGGNCVGIAIAGNTVIGSQLEGIFVVTSDSHGVTSNVSVTGNICRNNGKIGGTHAGIHVEALCGPISDCVIVGNCCSDDQPTKTQNYGIWEHQVPGKTASDDLIVGNDCIGNAGSTGNPVDIQLASSINGTKLAWCLGRYTSQGSA